jgi:hypothetical protein
MATLKRSGITSCDIFIAHAKLEAHLSEGGGIWSGIRRRFDFVHRIHRVVSEPTRTASYVEQVCNNGEVD